MWNILKSFLFFLFIGLTINQNTSCKSKISLSKKQDTLQSFPYWIAMMETEHVNYYKAVEAFEKYWENREKPTEQDGEGKNIFTGDNGNSTYEKDQTKSIEYIFEYKQFLNWKQRNKNLVKPDGTILSAEEILEQWNKNNKK